MKKRIIFVSVVAAVLLLSASICIIRSNSVDGIFKANVEALADVQHWGWCAESVNECMTVCPSCGMLLWAKGHKGPSKGVYEESASTSDSCNH